MELVALVSGQRHIIYNDEVSLKRRSSYYIDYTEVKRRGGGREKHPMISLARCIFVLLELHNETEGIESEERERERKELIKFTASYNYKLWSYELCWPYAKYLGRR